jgi:AcrR family transcriptional regulator
MPSTLTQANIVRRESILDSAGTVFFRFGFRKTSMDDVAKAAEVSRQCVYGYFPSKEALFREMIVHILDAALLKIGKLKEDGGVPLHDKLIRAFESLAGRQASQSIGGRLELFGAFCVHFEKDVADRYVDRLDNLVSDILADAAARKELLLDRATSLETAQTLRELSDGIASRCEDAGDFRRKMKRALRVVIPVANHGLGSAPSVRKEP